MRLAELMEEYGARRPELLRRFPSLVPSLLEASRSDPSWLGVVADLGDEARAELGPTERDAALSFLREALVRVAGEESFDLYELASIFAAAAGLRLDAKPLVDAWLALPGADMAVARVLAAEWITAEGEPGSLEEQIGRLAVKSSVPRFDHHVDPQHALVRALATEDVRAWIEERRLAEADPERQEILSAVEQRITAERALS